MHKKILLLDNYDSFTYNLKHYIESAGMFDVIVRRNNEITLEYVNNFECIVLSPGPGLPDDAGILKPLIENYKSKKKILGVCLGMQAIAEVYGGKLKNLKEVKHGVASIIKIIDQENVLYANLPSNFCGGRYHSWGVDWESLPKELIVTAIDEEGEIMSFRHCNLPIYGVQYHPESILSEFGKEVIGNFLKD